MNKDSVQRLLISGGAGAIGSQLAKKLIAQGYSVVVVDDESSGLGALVPKEATYIKGSIEEESVLEKCFLHKIDAVIHCAAHFANQNSVDFPEKDLSVNGMGTIRLLKFAQNHRVRKFLYTSSSCVYGKNKNMVEANNNYDLETPYAITKLLGEYYCQFWNQFHDLNCVTVRIFNNYGPGELPGKYRNVIPNFFMNAINGKPLVITGTGGETRDFNFVEDTTEGILLALFKNTEKGEVFNIGSGKETSVLQVAELINEIAGNKAGVVFQSPRPWDHVTRRLAVVDKAKEKLGYQPRTELRQGLHLTYRWLLENKAHFKS